MTTTPHRDVVDTLAAWLMAEVPGADAWTWYAEEPITPPGEPACAVWWDNSVPFTPDNTIGGWLGSAETYGIRYTEPATAQPRLVRDESADAAIEESMTAAIACVFAHTGDLAAPSHDMRWAGHSKLPSSRDSVIGWQITVVVRRDISFT